MTWPKTVLGAALIWIVPLFVGARTDPVFAEQVRCEVFGQPAPDSSVSDGSTCVWFVGGPACEDPSKVGPAVKDWPMQEDDEIERLGFGGGSIREPPCHVLQSGDVVLGRWAVSLPDAVDPAPALEGRPEFLRGGRHDP